jgi:class 3 adenylate cyclase
VTDDDLDRLAQAGVYDPDAADAAEQRAVLDRLLENGLTMDDLLAANRIGNLVLRAFERLILPGERVTLDAAATATGLPVGEVLRIRRAWGLADLGPSERAIAPTELTGLAFMASVAAFVGPEPALHVARVMGTAMSRMAEAEIALVRSRVEAPMVQSHASTAAMLVAYASLLEGMLPAALTTLDALHRAHLVAIGWRYSDRALPPSESNIVETVVGFADLTASTALVQRLDLTGLDHAITTFETVTSDVIAAAGATVVKRLGDGVMFVTAYPDVACGIALDLVDAFRAHPVAPPVRVGLAAGRVAALRGDFFGPPVHLAARIVGVAAPSTVLVSDDVRRRIEGVKPAVACTAEPPVALAGFETPVTLHRLERADSGFRTSSPVSS